MSLFVEGVGEPGSPPVMLLHGAEADHHMWDPQRDSLAQRFHLLLPDLPGYGKSSGPFSLDGAAEALHDTAGESSLHVTGLSGGAMVAVRWAARFPRDFASLILSGVQVRPRHGLERWRLRPVDQRWRADLRDDLGQVRTRTLVVCGAKDRRNVKASQAAAGGIAGAELRIVPGAGHLWNSTLPDLFNRMVRDWVER